MKARYSIGRPRKALTAAVAALVASALPLVTAAAQQQRGTPDPNAPRLMVGVFRSADKNAGVRVADAVRDRIASDFPLNRLYVLPKNDINANLEASGFPTNEALAPHDARALAQQLRADEYIVGAVTPASGGVNVAAQLILARGDGSLAQPLGSYQVGKADQASGSIAREFSAAEKAFGPERDCYNAARAQKYADAEAAARRGIAAYAKSTLARICLMQTYIAQRDQDTTNAARVRTYNDSVLALARDILTLDAASRPALTAEYAALQAAGQRDSATNVLLRLVGADPSNTRLLEQVVNELAANGQASRAIPFVRQLVTDNPGDPNYLSLQTRVLLAAKDYKGAAASFQELARTDTTAATADLFDRVALGARVDSQPQLAAQILAQGVKRYPNNGQLLSDYADALAASGQTQQAVDLLTRMAQSNPKAPGVYTALAQLYTTTNRPDSAFKALQQAKANGDNADAIAQSALGLGNAAYRAANSSKSPADYQKAITYLEFANSAKMTPQGQFLLGVASLGLGNAMLQDAQKNRSCASVAAARTAFTNAQINLPAGGRFDPSATQQALAALAQLSPYPDQLGTALRCGNARGR